MKDQPQRNIIEKLVLSTIELLDIKVSTIRLSVVEVLANMCSHAFGVLVLILFAGIALMLLTFAVTFLLAEIINSLVGALTIMGCIFLVFMAVCMPICKRLSCNLLINYFSKIICNDSEKDENRNNKA